MFDCKTTQLLQSNIELVQHERTTSTRSTARTAEHHQLVRARSRTEHDRDVEQTQDSSNTNTAAGAGHKPGITPATTPPPTGRPTCRPTSHPDRASQTGPHHHASRHREPPPTTPCRAGHSIAGSHNIARHPTSQQPDSHTPPADTMSLPLPPNNPPGPTNTPGVNHTDPPARTRHPTQTQAPATPQGTPPPPAPTEGIAAPCLCIAPKPFFPNPKGAPNGTSKADDRSSQGPTRPRQGPQRCLSRRWILGVRRPRTRCFGPDRGLRRPDRAARDAPHRRRDGRDRLAGAGTVEPDRHRTPAGTNLAVEAPRAAPTPAGGSASHP